MASKVVLILSTVPDKDTARRLARSWVEQAKAACVSILPGVESTYQWKGRLMQEEETLLLIKTAFDSEEEGQELLKAMAAEHPYEEPEFLVFEADSGAVGYLSWVLECVKDKG